MAGSVAGTVDEDARRRFEAAWRARADGASAPALEDFLPPADERSYAATLLELAVIDLELGLRAGLPRSAAAYLERFAALREADTLAELADEERRVRARHRLGVLDEEALAATSARFGLVTPRARIEPDGAHDVVLAPGMALGRYRLEAVQARGGFGVVWRASDVELGREIALKTLARPRDREVRARFLAEARVTARLEHPGIVPVHEVGDDGAPFYSMKLVRGRTLAETIRDVHGASAHPAGQLPRRAAEADRVARQRLLETFLALTRALGFAHARGVMHRDVKPDNVLVGAFGETVLLDWGLAKAFTDEARAIVEDAPPIAAPGSDDADGEAPRADTDERLTRAGTVLGTPAYMAPEQAEGRVAAHDARTDVYALGVVLREVLTGRRDGSLAKVPRPLAAIVAQATRAEPERRYRDANALAEDLERWLADAPVSAHHEGVGARLLRSMRRHKVRWVALAVALVLGAVSTAVALFVWQQQAFERRAAAEAASARDEALARSNLAAGRPEAAVAVLDLALARLTDPESASTPQALELRALRERAQRYQTFEREHERAWFLAGEERDQKALEVVRKALTAIGDGVRGPCSWLEEDLPLALSEACVQRAHRLMLLEVVLLAKGALAAPFSAESAAACEAAYRALERVRAQTPTAFGDLVQRLCATQSDKIPVVPWSKTTAPPSASDAYFFGLVNLYLKDMPSGLGWLSMLLGYGASGLDFDKPLDTAIDRLREAVRLEPAEYWHHFMLGIALNADNDPRAAAMSFGTCVAQRPDYPRGLEARGASLVWEGLSRERQELVGLGLAEIEAAVQLDVADPWSYWTRGGVMTWLGREDDAMADYQRALMLDPDGLWRVIDDAPEHGLSTRGALGRAAQLAAARLAKTPDANDALALAGAVQLVQGFRMEAEEILRRIDRSKATRFERLVLQLMELGTQGAEYVYRSVDDDDTPLGLAMRWKAATGLRWRDKARAALEALTVVAENDAQRAWAAERLAREPAPR